MKDYVIKDLFQDTLSAEHIGLIRENGLESEKTKRLTPAVLDLIYEKQWLQIMVPKKSSGLEWTLPQVVRLFEALAYADGSTGWNVNLGAGANLFSGYLTAEKSKELFQSPKTWCAGSGATTGKAIRVEKGYLLSGYWKYASGSTHATHFTANAILHDKEGNALLEDGKEVYKSFIIPSDKVKVIDTWNVLGLKATTSNDFEVKEVFVPDSEVFTLLKPSEFADAAIFQFSFDGLSFANMASMATGMSFHFLELFESLMGSKTPLYAETQLGNVGSVKELFFKHKNLILQARNEWLQEVDEKWEFHVEEGKLTPKMQTELIKASRKTAELARNMLAELIPLCGMDVLFVDNEISRVWRDLTVGTQHFLLSPLYQAK